MSEIEKLWAGTSQVQEHFDKLNAAAKGQEQEPEREEKEEPKDAE